MEFGVVQRMERKSRGFGPIMVCALALLAGPLQAAEPSIRAGELAAQEQNWVTALSNWEPLADQGNPRAQFYLAGIYDQGLGVPKDTELAVQWLIKSAKNGYPLAQFNLGNGFFKRGEEKDFQQAALWWNAAAEQGFFPAQYNLAVLYEEGQGVPKDQHKAAYWYREAAKLGSDPAKEALTRLGLDEGSRRAAAQPKKPPPPALASAPANTRSAAAPGDGPLGPEWVQAQPVSHYTLQLASNQDPANAQALARRFTADGEVAIYSFRDKKETLWYRVILGSFASKKEADARARSIQSRLGDKPWVRKFGAIQGLL